MSSPVLRVVTATCLQCFTGTKVSWQVDIYAFGEWPSGNHRRQLPRTPLTYSADAELVLKACI